MRKSGERMFLHAMFAKANRSKLPALVAASLLASVVAGEPCSAERRGLDPQGLSLAPGSAIRGTKGRSFSFATYGQSVPYFLGTLEGNIVEIGNTEGYLALRAAARGFHATVIETTRRGASLFRYSLCMNPLVRSRVNLLSYRGPLAKEHPERLLKQVLKKVDIMVVHAEDTMALFANATALFAKAKRVALLFEGAADYIDLLRDSGLQIQTVGETSLFAVKSLPRCITPPFSKRVDARSPCGVFRIYVNAKGKMRHSSFPIREEDFLINKRFLDIGAGVGWTTLAAASCGIHVVSVEPFRKYTSFLKAGICANAFGSLVKLIKVGLDTKEQSCDVYSKLDMQTSHNVCDTSAKAAETRKDLVAKGFVKTGALQLKTLDQLMETGGLGSVPFDAMRLDVEGSELRVLLGGNGFFSSRLAPRAVLVDMMSLRQKLQTGRGASAMLAIRVFLESHGYHNKETDDLEGDAWANRVDGSDLWFVRKET